MSFFLTQVVLSTPLIAAYALFAVGIVLIYRASRVLNLAHGVMAMLPAYVVNSLRDAGVPMVGALVLGIVAGAALGAAVELVFVRRLRSVSPTAQTVGTVAVFGLVVALVAKFFGTTPIRTQGVFPDKVILFGASGMSYGQIGLIVVACVLTAALFALFKYTSLGLAMRGAASNRRAASLVGVDPDRTTLVAWAMGGALAAVAGILLSGVTSLDPFQFPLQALPAFVAALIGGLASMPGALLGSAVVGLTVGVVPGLQHVPVVSGFAGSIGAPQAVLALVAFVVMAMRGEKLAATDVRSGGLT
jgi:branched-subunit amino acid ABC-type transport system permease component